MIVTIENLAELGNVVDDNYQHSDKRIAWTEYLRSNRDEAAKRAYLASRVSRTI